MVRSVLPEQINDMIIGFTNASARQRFEAFLRRRHRHGSYPAGKPSVTQLVTKADESLFRSTTHFPTSPSFPLT